MLSFKNNILADTAEIYPACIKNTVQNSQKCSNNITVSTHFQFIVKSNKCVSQSYTRPLCECFIVKLPKKTGNQ